MTSRKVFADMLSLFSADTIALVESAQKLSRNVSKVQIKD